MTGLQQVAARASSKRGVLGGSGSESMDGLSETLRKYRISVGGAEGIVGG